MSFENRSLRQKSEASEEGINLIRRKCLRRGLSDLKCFSMAFRHFDKDYSRQINFSEFQSGLESYGIKLPEEEQKKLFLNFDKDE